LLLAEFSPRQYTDAFARISRARAEALFVSWTPAAYADRALIVDFATRARLPSAFFFRESVELGGLMSYGVSVTDNHRRAAGYVAKILKGAKSARPARRAAQQVRAGDQPQDRQGARADDPAVAAGEGRRGHPVTEGRHDGVIDTIERSCQPPPGGSEHGATNGIGNEATPHQH